MKQKILVLFAMLLVLFGITSCNKPKNTIKNAEDYDLLSVKSLDQLTKLTKPESRHWWWGTDDMVKEDNAKPEAPTSVDSEGTSKTNVQVAGVDESDVVKNNNRYIYIANYIGLSIVDTETEAVYQHKFPNFNPNELFLYDNYLVILGTVWEEYSGGGYGKIAIEYDFGRCYPYYAEYFKVIVLDVTNPENPEIMREFAVDGSYYLQGRMIENTLYLVLQKYQIYRYDKKKAIIPTYTDTAEQVTDKPLSLDQIKIIGGDDYYYCYTVLASFNVDEQNAPDVNAYLGNFNIIYSSQNNLYGTRYANLAQKQVSEDGTTTEISSYSITHTVIYRFNYQDNKIVYQGKGFVKGELHNQFSLDEYEGVLRVAHTTREYQPNTWNFVSESFVSTFAIKEKAEFKFLASVGGMGINELIYSVRFNGPVGYLVTFKTIDPLYVVDLSNPIDPVVKSELKSPGVSDYLHIIIDGLLLGIGRSTEVTPYGATITKGVKISLFDVSNPNETKEVDILFMDGEYSYTELQYNHKALLTLPVQQLYALPVYYSIGYQYKQGMYVFDVDVDNTKLNYRGLISHQINKDWEDQYYYFYSNVIVRGVIVNYKLYTISQSLVGVNLLDENLTHVKYLSLYPQK